MKEVAVKSIVILWMVAVFGCIDLVAQQKTAVMPAGAINGAISPEQIPDAIAYKLVFLSLRAGPSADAVALKHQQIRVHAIGLSEADAASLKTALRQFAVDISLIHTAANSAQGRSETPAAERRLVEQVREALSTRLSKDGAAKLAEYVHNEKSRMIVVPE